MNSPAAGAAVGSRLYLVREPVTSVSPTKYLSDVASLLNQNHPLVSRSAAAKPPDEELEELEPPDDDEELELDELLEDEELELDEPLEEELELDDELEEDELLELDEVLGLLVAAAVGVVLSSPPPQAARIRLTTSAAAIPLINPCFLYICPSSWLSGPFLVLMGREKL